jgi:hypothetical protein
LLTLKFYVMDNDFDFGFADFDFSGSPDFGDQEDELQPIPDNFEEATKQEVSEYLLALKERAKKEEARKKEMTDTDYWVAVYFADKEQRDNFLQKVGVLDALVEQYLNGQTLAEALGIDIGSKRAVPPKAFQKPADIGDITMDFFTL